MATCFLVASNFILVLKKPHVSNGCNMYLLRSPEKRCLFPGSGCLAKSINQRPKTKQTSVPLQSISFYKELPRIWAALGLGIVFRRASKRVPSSMAAVRPKLPASQTPAVSGALASPSDAESGTELKKVPWIDSKASQLHLSGLLRNFTGVDPKESGHFSLLPKGPHKAKRLKGFVGLRISQTGTPLNCLP